MRRLGALAALVGAVALAGCGSSGHSSGGSVPAGSAAGVGVITVAQARQLLSRFQAVNDQANKARQESTLSGVEGGTSLQLDAQQYKFTAVTDPSNNNYTPLSYVNPVFFIPRQSGYPAWFVVRTLQSNAASPSKNQEIYLVFSKASASAPWLDLLEPGAYGLPAQQQPQVSAASGMAVTADPADGSGLAIAPAKLPAADVSYLNAGNYSSTPARPGLPTPSRPAVVSFGNGMTGLVAYSDQKFFQGQLPSGSTELVSHQTTADPVYALRTTSGGVLVFYDLTASLTLGAPFAQPFAITIPGIFDGKQQDTSYQVNYDEQYAVYEPPGASAKPVILANYSGQVSGECDGGPCSN
jgi:hypothetical protein